MWRNFLLHEHGNKINTILAAKGLNLRKMLQQLKAGAINTIYHLLKDVYRVKVAA